jgi:hypothetical protein
MPGTQDQKVKFTGPLEVLLLLGLELPPQAAREAMSTNTIPTMVNRDAMRCIPEEEEKNCIV